MNITVVVAALVSPSLVIACSANTDRAPHNIDIRTAPLNLPGIDFACYDVRVENGAATPETVIARGTVGQSLVDGDTTTLCSTRFGNGPGGDISYVAPCDAQLASHTVTLWVDGVYTGTPEVPVMIEYQDPCPTGCALPVTCVENADTPVTFNLTIMRPANQGFFDIAVNFDDIFCSAKVDCETDGGLPLNLLHHPVSKERAQTVVLALACSAGPGATDETVLFRNPIVVTCAGMDPIVLDPTLGEGNVFGPVIADPDPADPVWQYATYFGDEALDCGGMSCNKRYWNVAVGFDPLAADCTITTSATAASGTSMPGFTPPEAAVYPFIEVDVPLTGVGGGLVCAQHPLNGSPTGVTTTYTDPTTEVHFCHRYDGTFQTDDGPPCSVETPMNLVDESFGDDGNRYLSYGTDGGYPWGVGTDSQGRIIILTNRTFENAVRYSLTRLLADGTTDTTFGTDGWVTGSIPEVPIDSNMRMGISIDADDNIYAGVQAAIGPRLNHRQIGVLKLDTNGARDATFGTNGYVTYTLTTIETTMQGIIPLDDGKVLVMGVGHSNRTGNNNYSAVVIRLNADGTRDLTYGTDSPWQYTPFGESGTMPGSINIVADGYNYSAVYAFHKGAGGIYLAGYGIATASGLYDCFVMKLGLDGALDQSFGTNGYANYTVLPTSNELCNGITGDEYGNIYPMGLANYRDGAGRHSLVFKIDANGNLDPDYGVGGLATYQVGGSTGDMLSAHGSPGPGVVLADGTFVGVSSNPGTSVVVLNAAGVIDSNFDPTDNDPTFIRMANGAYTRPMAASGGRHAFLNGGQIHLTMYTTVNGFGQTVITRLENPSDL